VKKYISILLLLSACASVTSPTGGPKDEAPPELESSNPESNQRNFKGEAIELTFNELIKLKDPKEEILITPSPGKDTKFTVKKNKLLIEPQNPWTENTTYSINFREGVQDLNESNSAENLRLAFSTGPVIDSLSISGSVKETFSEKPPDKITVALYQSDTFNIYSHTPTYFTKCNKEGKFSIQNLKSGAYYLYAFDDKNKNLKVDSKTERFGFLVQPFTLFENIDSTSISLITLDARPIQLTSVRHTEKTTRIRYNKGVDSLQVISDKPVYYTFGDNTNEVIYYHNITSNDSIKSRLIAIDSLGQKTDSTIFVKRSDTKMAEEGFVLKDISEKYDYAKRTYTHTLTYNKPIALLRPDSIYVQIDSAITKPIRIENIAVDTIRHSITVKTETIPIDTAAKSTKSKVPLALIYAKSAFISHTQDTSKKVTKQIKFLDAEETGLVTIGIQTEKPNFIIELISTDDKVYASAKNVKTYTFKFVKAQEYKVRIIIDGNGNGKWDAGNYLTRTEPEQVFYYKSDEGKYTFPIRANWEYGPLVIKF
jgi:uncharacterized protein (DUF2141 family)